MDRNLDRQRPAGLGSGFPGSARHADFVVQYTLDDGYSGELGYGSAAVMGDFVVVDMFAEACSGNKSSKAAAHDAAERIKRYYKA